MIKIIQNAETEDIIFKDNDILIMSESLSSKTIKELGRKVNKVGIYYRNGVVLDTANGIIVNIDREENCSYELESYETQEDYLIGLINYNEFYDFIQMKEYFQKYYKINLYWDEKSKKCVYEKTNILNKIGGATPINAFKPIKQININSESFKKIKFVPNLQETLNSFIQETNIIDYLQTSGNISYIEECGEYLEKTV